MGTVSRFQHGREASKLYRCAGIAYRHFTATLRPDSMRTAIDNIRDGELKHRREWRQTSKSETVRLVEIGTR